MAESYRICLPIQKSWVRSLSYEDPLEKEMATHSSILAWRIHRLRSLASYSPRGRKESDTTEHKHTDTNQKLKKSAGLLFNLVKAT